MRPSLAAQVEYETNPGECFHLLEGFLPLLEGQVFRDQCFGIDFSFSEVVHGANKELLFRAPGEQVFRAA
jgi:hypothetical protein